MKPSLDIKALVRTSKLASAGWPVARGEVREANAKLFAVLFHNVAVGHPIGVDAENADAADNVLDLVLSSKQEGSNGEVASKPKAGNVNQMGWRRHQNRLSSKPAYPNRARSTLGHKTLLVIRPPAYMRTPIVSQWLTWTKEEDDGIRG